VSLADFGDTSIRAQVLYFTADPDWDSHMAIRERINLGILKALGARGVVLANPFPAVRADSPKPGA